MIKKFALQYTIQQSEDMQSQGIRNLKKSSKKVKFASNEFLRQSGSS